MFTLAVRGLIGLAATVAGIAVWTGLVSTPTAVAAPPFSKVVEKLQSLDSLQLKVKEKGEWSDVWVRTSGMVRRQLSPKHYQIAIGSRLWKIDESQNTAVENDSPWFETAEKQFDLLRLLQLSGFKSATPLKHVEQGGVDCIVYRVELNSKFGSDAEVVVEAGTLRLKEVVARFSAPDLREIAPVEVQVVALNLPIDDDKFVVAKSLTEDGRIGKINAAQGIAGLRPVMAKRWTPICRDTLLKPGDWLRTEIRGANALKVTLSSQVEVTVGPGSLLECISPKNVRLHYGQAQVVVPKGNDASEKSPFTLLAARDGERKFQAGEKQLVRIDQNEKLVNVPATPVWLAGFDGTSSNESLGSLIVQVDGRNEPLTVGYHKVSVEIRDQIARTTIEESFVNHTAARLAGEFNFPLPSDASISGFGMWIGNDLVEADVVEKQRAREIYETILRERRDPGLLEWTSGNIFKASVFPIEPHSEKRIKIVYTQVLPLRANRYRYSYGLRSEMLRTKPLRELSLKVTVNSAIPLKSISCPTHPARTQKTANSGQVEFVQQEYTPTRDFEVVCEIDGRTPDVVVIPHRRGEDGYFLVQLTPPSEEGNWQRELLPDGQPLQLVLLCDTSASMDADKRKQQSEFVASVLSSLGPSDKFLLGAVDVNPAWLTPDLVTATADDVAKAKGFLEKRVSLGWTNLDRAFTEVLKKARPGSHVIYIGDGIVSAGDTSPAAFVQRLKQIVAQSQAMGGGGGRADASSGPPVLHAVTVGNTSESVVMKGIASVGKGSTRIISGEQSPSVVSLELLNEIAQPGLRDVQIEFRGVKVAAVHPEKLPNVPAGTQQLLVGRYLPEGRDQSGELVLTGTRGSQKITSVAKINLKDAEEGNSFIPRLWARSHLDFLLAQGTSSTVHEDIIRLSEEFHIITPYTSLLVLETDADRERFGVKRRFEMRDGEKFFAQGKANANFELLQQQMKRAADWRIGLRRQVLHSLIGLGRSQRSVEPQHPGANFNGRFAGSGPFGGGGRGGAGGMPFGMSVSSTSAVNGPGAYFDSAPRRGGYVDYLSAGEGSFDEYRVGLGIEDSTREDRVELLGTDKAESDRELAGEMLADYDAPDDSMGVSEWGDRDEKMDFESYAGAMGKRAGKPMQMYDRNSRRQIMLQDGLESEELMFLPELKKKAAIDGRGLSLHGSLTNGLDLDFGRIAFEPASRAGEFYRYTNSANYTSWVETLFPPLAPPPAKHVPLPKAREGWSAEALALSRSLLRVDALQKLDGGIELSRITRYLDPRWKRQSGRSSDFALYSPMAWMTRGRNYREQTVVSYCTAQERGIYSQAYLLGRVRASVAAELKAPPLGLTDFSLDDIAESHPDDTVKLEAAGENQSRLILTRRDSSDSEHLLIDTAKHVLIKHEWFSEGKLTSSMTFSDFVEVAGTWWATKIVTLNAEGQQVAETTIAINAVLKGNYAERIRNALAAKPSVQFVHLPFVTLRSARQKVVDGAAGFDDRLAMILFNAQLQQWDEMWKHVEAAEKVVTDKPGVRWIRTQLLIAIRRNEEARQRLLEEARKLVAHAHPDQLYLADAILNQAYGVTGWSEFLELVNVLKPVYERPINPDGMELTDPEVIQSWNGRLVQCDEALGRNEQALELRRQMAVATPWQLSRQEEYAQRLAATGQFDAAHAWLRQELARPERRPDEDHSLRTVVATLYRQQFKWAELLNWTTEWIARTPDTSSYNSAYAQHLAALICNDKLDEAYALADRWLKEAQIEGKLSPVQTAHLDAALYFAAGSLPDLNFNRMNSRWFEPLAAAARFFVRQPEHFNLVQRCVSNHYFGQSDDSDRLRGEWLNLLRNELEKLNPTQINTLVGWTLSGRMEFAEPLNGRKQLEASEVPNEIWQKISTALVPRWQQATDKTDRHLLGETIKTIYTTRFREAQLLPFLRQRQANAHLDYRTAYTSDLFNELLSTKWSDAIEQEAFAVWRTLYKAPEPMRWSDELEPAELTRLRQLEDLQHAGERLSVEVPALYRLVDAMLANRAAAAEQQLSDQGGQDKLTRQELAKKRGDIRKEAKVELAKRLVNEAKANEAEPMASPLAPWLNMERMWLDMQLDQNLDAVATDCWKILGEAPPVSKAVKDDEAVDSAEFELAQAKLLEDFYDSVLKRRAFTTVMNLATRKTASPESVARVLKYIDAGIAQQPPVPATAKVNDPKVAVTEPADPVLRSGYDAAQAWKLTKFRFLVARDQADELEAALRDWIRTDISTAPWRQWLARLLAERGKLDEAIALFEACEKDKLLTAADYRLLADWYLATNRRDAYERTRIETYKLLPEHHLSQLIERTRYRWADSGLPLPSELDEDTLFIFKALFEKSASPEAYTSQLRNLYGACRDFRLLQVLPDAALGRSPQQAYNYLQGVNSQVLIEVRNEATADEILARSKKLREGKLTPTDLRALDLLEALVERKASEVLNQPGPHVTASVAAMQRAFQRDWVEGEPLMMSAFLYQLGGITNPTLRDEQLREMRALQKIPAPATRDHLRITNNLCQLLFWNYTRHDEALREIEPEISAYVQAHQGLWPHADNDVLERIAGMYEGANRHMAGETLLKRFIAKPENDEQRKWLQDRLMSLYNHALESGSAVSLGSTRDELFAAILALSLKELDAAPDENVRYNLVSRVLRTFDIAHRNKVSGIDEPMRKFAFETLPDLLKKQQQQYRNTAVTPVYQIGEILGHRAALQYIVERMEQYPQRLEIQWDNSWNTFGSQLAERRHQTGSTDLDARVLKLAIARLKEDLRTGDSNYPYIYRRDYSNYFWAEKAADFAKAAEEVLNERRMSGRQAMRIAQYLRHGLSLLPRAIEILLIAHQNGLLEESSQYQLVQWLREAGRHGEMIPLLQPLIAEHLDNIVYRTELMAAYFATQRPEQLAELTQKTHDHFHQKGLWTEANAAQFARGCQGSNQLEKAAGYFNEAISLHQRANPGSGHNDQTLSSYYQELAGCEARLKHTEAAVSAASAAIVCWDARQQQRTYALNALREVLQSSSDLDAYVKTWNAQTTMSGQDSPVLRKAMGQVYQSKGEFAKAIVQFKLAVDLQPNDTETHQALIACYDATQNAAAATQQLLQLIDLHPHNLELFKQLANRMKNNEAEAERATTSIIESAPTEAASHAAVAEIRQEQNRWSEAIPHWQQVAELRRLEPTGLLKLAQAQIHEKQFNAAKASLDKLQHTTWPSRFENDVNNGLRNLQEQMPK